MIAKLNVKVILFAILIVLLGCQSDDESSSLDNDEDQETELYFPNDNSSWENLTPEDLNWNSQKMQELLDFLEENNSRGFIILKDGKIAIEEYWGDNLLGNSAFNEETFWYWASAGKSLTSVLMGIAQDQELVDLNKPISEYIGNGWSSLTAEQENAITLKNHLNFTTGIDYNVDDLNCFESSCFNFLNEPSTQWYYHNATYTILREVIEEASNQDYTQFTNQNLGNEIGLSGFWNYLDSGANVYFSSTKGAARFGLLILAEGRWKENQILPHAYINEMLMPTQDLNESYGYLWWLNGQSSFKVPNLTVSFQGSLLPDAPRDLILALGLNGQFIAIVPSQQLVIVRFGENPGGDPLTIEFVSEVFNLLEEIQNH